MSHTFSHPICNHTLTKIKSLVYLMRNHANKASRGLGNKWHLTWYADRIAVTFEEEPDWAFFNATFLNKHLKDLAYIGQIPNAKMIRDMALGSAEASEVIEEVLARLRQSR